ncbi:MAG: copper resistance protein CopD [Gemmatimonadota bacterium]
MSPTYQALIFLHLLAAFVWLGGILFLVLVGAPVIRRVAPAELRGELFMALGLRLRWVGWGALGVLVATGTWILHLRGLLRMEVMGDPAWWGTAMGRALGWKLGTVALMIVLTAAHDLLEGSGGARQARVRGLPSRRVATTLARGSALVALIVLYWAMRVARGG